MKFLIDAFSWIEFLKGSSEGLKVKEFLDNNEIYTSTITIAEVLSKVKRENSDIEIAYKAINSYSKTISLSDEIAKEAGLLHAEIYKKIKDMGLVDCILIITARKISAKIVTGDRHFKNFKEAVLIR
jgi:predicted nucleic acid-binding protein